MAHNQCDHKSVSLEWGKDTDWAKTLYSFWQCKTCLAKVNVSELRNANEPEPKEDDGFYYDS